MGGTVQITVLVDNTVHGADLLAEHGLSFYIQCPDGHRILFDTGQGHVLVQNASRLQLPLDSLEAICLSHGHYDHSGGLAHVLAKTGQVKIYAHPASLEPKFARPKEGPVREIGMPPIAQAALQDPKATFRTTESPTEVCPGLMLTGPVPRTTEFEDTGGPFFLDREAQRPDPLLDDQAIYFQTDRGTVVLLGCAHAGLVSTLQYVHELTQNEPIYAVMGGMHLGNVSSARVQRSMEALRQFGVVQIAPAHCTGWTAMMALSHTFGDLCMPCHVGARFEFPRK